jgi:hypothetical protein
MRVGCQLAVPLFSDVQKTVQCENSRAEPGQGVKSMMLEPGLGQRHGHKYQAARRYS